MIDLFKDSDIKYMLLFMHIKHNGRYDIYILETTVNKYKEILRIIGNNSTVIYQ